MAWIETLLKALRCPRLLHCIRAGHLDCRRCGCFLRRC